MVNRKKSVVWFPYFDVFVVSNSNWSSTNFLATLTFWNIKLTYIYDTIINLKLSSLNIFANKSNRIMKKKTHWFICTRICRLISHWINRAETIVPIWVSMHVQNMYCMWKSAMKRKSNVKIQKCNRNWANKLCLLFKCGYVTHKTRRTFSIPFWNAFFICDLVQKFFGTKIVFATFKSFSRKIHIKNG